MHSRRIFYAKLAKSSKEWKDAMRMELLPTSDLDFMRSILQKVNGSLLFLFVFLLLSGQALYLSLPSILGRLVDQFAKNDYTLTFWLLSFPIVWLTSVILSSFGRFYCSIITQRVRNISKEIIFKYLVGLPSSVYVTKDAGEVESLMQELSFNARFIFNENLSFFLRTAVTLLAAMVMLAMISAGLLALFLTWLVIYIPNLEQRLSKCLALIIY